VEYTLTSCPIFRDQLRTAGLFEPETVDAISKVLATGDTFFDIGTHVGQYTLIASDIVGDAGSVHCFEADIATYEILKKNIKGNNLSNVYPNNLAISDKSGNAVLHRGINVNIGTSSIVHRPYNYSGETISIETISLDEYCNQNSIEKIDLIKVDIEGAEHLFLRGGRRMFTNSSPPIIVMEINNTIILDENDNIFEIMKLLDEYNYRSYRIYKNGIKKYSRDMKDENQFNVICFPKICEKMNKLKTL
jgi:FkbM family methyltransferase